MYRIYLAIRQGFRFSRMTTYNLISLMKFALILIFSFRSNPEDRDPSYKMDLDLLDYFVRKITLSYNRRNTVWILKAPEMNL